MGLQDFDGGAHGGAALSFKRGDLVAVYDKDDESLWQGVNVQNDSMGYFPCQLVRKIAESTKLLEEPKEAKPKPPLLETLKLTEMAIPASPLSADVATVPSPIITDEQVTIQFDFCYFIFLFLFLQFEAAKAELEKQAPAPDKAGVLKVQLERKKWVESHCVVKDHILFYSKPVKKGGAPQVVHLSLQGLMVRPATHAEVSKHDLALAFVVTPVGSKSSEAHIFAAPDLSERQSWIEILTLASAGASVNGNDVKLFIFLFLFIWFIFVDVRRSSYDYNSDATKTVRGKSFLGLDSKGNVSETQAGRSPVQREAWMEGLSDEIIAQVQAAAPKGDGKVTGENTWPVFTQKKKFFFFREFRKPSAKVSSVAGSVPLVSSRATTEGKKREMPLFMQNKDKEKKNFVFHKMSEDGCGYRSSLLWLKTGISARVLAMRAASRSAKAISSS